LTSVCSPRKPPSPASGVASASALSSGAHETCCCVGAALLALTVLVRWRRRDFSRPMTAGILIGGLPYLCGLGTGARLSAEAAIGSVSLCAMAALLAGLATGLYARGQPSSTWLLATTTGALTALLGVVGFGYQVGLAVWLALATGSTLTRALTTS
jgi:hypothetical protein